MRPPRSEATPVAAAAEVGARVAGIAAEALAAALPDHDAPGSHRCALNSAKDGLIRWLQWRLFDSRIARDGWR